MFFAPQLISIFTAKAQQSVLRNHGATPQSSFSKQHTGRRTHNSSGYAGTKKVF
jgi:expansin (peptidoglycan-binding protein)